MSGSFNAGGLITGLDTNNIIRQLIAIERLPIDRAKARITTLETQKKAIADLRAQLQTFRGRAQDFRFGFNFNKFLGTSLDEKIATASATTANPTTGAFQVEVLQLASTTVATGSTVLGASINPAATLDSSGILTDITAGNFTINGKTISVDPATQSLNTILSSINGSVAGVTATYDALNDVVVIENSTPADTSIINFGAGADTSNFLTATNLKNAPQSTGLGGSTEVQSSTHLGAVDGSATLNTVSFKVAAVTAGTFFVNGVQITVDPATDSLDDVISAINASDAGVTASLDTSTDKIRVVSKNEGSRTIDFAAGTSNFLTVSGLDTAVQTAGNDTQFKIDGGPAQTRNSNTVEGAIGGVTLELKSLGTTTVTISRDNESSAKAVEDLLSSFNEAVTKIRELTGEGGTLKGDSSVSTIESFLRSTVFKDVSSLTGAFNNFLDIGISTGDSFDPQKPVTLELDRDAFLEALADDPDAVADVFANDAEDGIADQFFDYLEELTGTFGPLNGRAGANGGIDQQIQSTNDQIDRIELRVAQRERRLRAQFARLEQLSAGFQQQNSSLGALGSGFSALIR